MTPTDTYLPGSGAAAKDDSFPTQYPMVRYLTYKAPPVSARALLSSGFFASGYPWVFHSSLRAFGPSSHLRSVFTEKSDTVGEKQTLGCDGESLAVNMVGLSIA